MIVIDGYAPDLDSTGKGVLTSCSTMVPTLRGMKGAPSAVSVGADALTAACQGAAVLTKLDDTTRLFAGTATKLYELSGTSWTDRTRASGGNYAIATDARWSFSQFGNVSLAVNKADILQSSSSGAFANVGASVPKASIVETVGQFVFLFDTNEATYGDSPNRWWCCAKGDVTDWTPAVATESATGLLTSVPGPIRAGKRFGDTIIAYKEKGMFQGVYLGGGAIWDFRELPGTAGALSQQAVVSVGTSEEPKHIFMGHDDFYVFDGAKAVPIGAPVRETVYSEMQRTYAHLSRGTLDKTNGLVRFYYCSTGTTPDKCVVYNYKTDKWGRDDLTVEDAFEYVAAGVTYDGLGSSYSTYSDLPNVAYDSSFWTARTPIPAIFNSSHVLQTLNGQSSSSSFTTGDFGDENLATLIGRISPRWLTKPTSATLTNFYRASLGDALTTDQTTNMDSRARFDFMREALWHRLQLNFTGPVELAMLNPATEAGGSE